MRSGVAGGTERQGHTDDRGDERADERHPQRLERGAQHVAPVREIRWEHASHEAAHVSEAGEEAEQ